MAKVLITARPRGSRSRNKVIVGEPAFGSLHGRPPGLETLNPAIWQVSSSRQARDLLAPAPRQRAVCTNPPLNLGRPLGAPGTWPDLRRRPFPRCAYGQPALVNLRVDGICWGEGLVERTSKGSMGKQSPLTLRAPSPEGRACSDLLDPNVHRLIPFCGLLAGMELLSTLAGGHRHNPPPLEAVGSLPAFSGTILHR